MRESERNHLLKQLRLLRFAAGDMQQARAAIIALLETTDDDNEDDLDLILALETAIVICYARPFTHGEGVGRLGEEWAPEDEDKRAMHDEMLVLRNQLYAHTDMRSGRDSVERFEFYGEAAARARPA